jgi:hypothetical protein
MGKSPNGKPSRKTPCQTCRAQWKRRKRRKNRNTRAKQPGFTFVFRGFHRPQTIYAIRSMSLVECPLCGRMRSLSPGLAASSGSKHTLERRAADPTDLEALVGHRKNGLGRGGRITEEMGEGRARRVLLVQAAHPALACSLVRSGGSADRSRA